METTDFVKLTGFMNAGKKDDIQSLFNMFKERITRLDIPFVMFVSKYQEEIKIIVRSFGSSKNTKLEDGPYCTISGSEPSSVTLYKTGSDLLQFQEFTSV